MGINNTIQWEATLHRETEVVEFILSRASLDDKGGL